MEPMCYYCDKATRMAGITDVICKKKGIISGNSTCRKFKECETAKKVMKMPVYSPDDFKLK